MAVHDHMGRQRTRLVSWVAPFALLLLIFVIAVVPRFLRRSGESGNREDGQQLKSSSDTRGTSTTQGMEPALATPDLAECQDAKEMSRGLIRLWEGALDNPSEVNVLASQMAALHRRLEDPSLGESSLRSLRKVAVDHDLPDMVRALALLQLGGISEDEAAKTIEQALKEGADRVFIAALLSKMTKRVIGIEDADYASGVNGKSTPGFWIQMLALLATESGPRERRLVDWMVEAHGDSSGPSAFGFLREEEDPNVRDVALTRVLTSRDSWVRGLTLTLLARGTLKEDLVMAAYGLAMAQDTDEAIRIQAASYVSSIRNTHERGRLVRDLLLQVPPMSARDDLINAYLDEFGSLEPAFRPLVHDTVSHFMNYEPSEVPVLVRALIGKCASDEEWGLLEPLLASGQTEEGRLAVASRLRIPASDERTTIRQCDLLEKYSNDNSPAVRRAALKSLFEIIADSSAQISPSKGRVELLGYVETKSEAEARNLAPDDPYRAELRDRAERARELRQSWKEAEASKP